MSASRFSGSVAKIAAAIAAVALTTSPCARAQSDNRVAAEDLFQQARKLLEAGRYPEACEKLAASQHLDPAVGTLVNLAHCYEKVGRTATAWETYREAARAAHQAGQTERERTASKSADALEPALPRLTVQVTPQRGDVKPDVTRDGVSVVPEIWGTAVPVDPGDHTLAASAPNRKPWTMTIHVGPRGQETVSVPALELVAPLSEPAPPAPSVAAVVPATPESPPSTRHFHWSGQRAWALVAAGLGLAGGAVAVVELLAYGNNKSQADSLCPGACVSVPDHAKAVSLLDTAQTNANIAIVSGAVGGAALVTGAVLWLTADKEPQRASGLRVVPLATTQAAELQLRGSW
jgi:serine/threonine-protein kinase